MNFTLIILTLLPLLVATADRASAQQLPLTAYDRSGGLLSDYVTCMVQDTRGFIWFGSDRGVSRYDGATFRHYGLEEGFPDPFITTMYPDTDGSVLAGTHEGGVVRIDGDGLTVLDTSSGLLSNRISGITRDRYGTLFVETAGGISWFGRVDTGSLPGPDQTWFFVELADGTMLYSRTDSAFLMVADEVKGYKMEKVSVDISRLAFGGRIINGRGHQTKQGDLFASTLTGLHRLRLSRNGGFSEPEFILNTSVVDFAEGPEGELWIGTETDGLYRYDGHSLDRYSIAEGLPTRRIESLLLDYEGNLWIAVFGHGVRKLTAGNVRRFTVTNGLPDDRIECFARDGKGRLWIGTQSGLAVYENNAVRSIPNPKGLLNEVRRFAPGPDGTLYAGSLRHLLGPFDPDRVIAGTPARFRVVPYGVAGIVPYGPAGQCLIGTYGNGTALSTSDGVKSLEPHGGMAGVMIDGLMDGPGGPWILTRHRGLFRLDDTGFVAFTESAGIPIRSVYSLLELPGSTRRDPRLWIGSTQGLDLISGEARVSFRTGNGLLGAPVIGLHRLIPTGPQVGDPLPPDGAYAVTADAVHLVSRDSIRILQPFSFLPSRSVSVNASFLDDGNSTLWLATTGGAYRIDLSRVPPPAPPPRIAVTSVSGGGLDSACGPGCSALPVILPPIPYGQGDITVKYAGLTFRNEASVRYRTRLEPIDSSWSLPTQSRSIRISSLGDGDYRLSIVAVNDRDETSAIPAVVIFTVDPPFWRRWWFLGATFGLLLALVVGSARAVTMRKVRATIRTLEDRRAVQDERERISRDLHDHVGSQLAGLITGLELARRYGEADEQKKRELLDALGEDARTSMEQLRETIWAMQSASLTIDLFCAEVRKHLQHQVRYLPSVRFTLNRRGDGSAVLHPHEVLEAYRLTQEAVTNVLRHSKPTTLTVSIGTDEEGWMEVTVENDGAAPPGGEPRLLAGRGLRNMSRRMENLGGSFAWELTADNVFRIRGRFPRKEVR